MPISKTHSFRALILGSLAGGVSYVRNPKLGGDWHGAVQAMKMFGAKIKEVEPNIYQIKGTGGELQAPSDVINVSNSGTMFFLTAGVAAACPGWSVITGDESIRKFRKITKNLFQPFKDLGVEIISTKNDGMAPLVIKGRVDGGVAHMNGEGCQPVFSVLVASAMSQKPVEIFVSNPGEKAYIDLLLYWFDKVSLKYKNIDNKYEHYVFPGNKPPKVFDITIPFEWSAAAYPLLAAIITLDSEITIRGMDLNDPYGDKQVIYILQQMGAMVTEKEDGLIIDQDGSWKLKPAKINSHKDHRIAMTLALAGLCCEGETLISNAEFIEKSFETFIPEMIKTGAHFELQGKI